MIRSIVTATAACAAAACMIGAAVPALAKDAEPAMTYNAKAQTFCTARAPVTGSLIERPECHTAAAWADEGLTVRRVTRVAQR